MKNVYDGQLVLVYYREKEPILCKVACAAGYSARVVSLDGTFDHWCHIDWLRDPSILAQKVHDS